MTHEPQASPSYTALSRDTSLSDLHHIAIVPDGNRRWAQRVGATTPQAYVAAAHKALEAAEWCLEAGARHLSAFALSQENLAMRPADEVEAIRAALFVFFDGLRALDYTQLHLFGDTERLAEHLPEWRPLLAYSEPREASLTVHVGLNYSGQAEIDAVARAARAFPTEGLASPDQLLLSAGVPAVDLVFRTGGQQRLSGFLPFQTTYAELWFTQTLWPDLTRQEFTHGIAWFALQERRLGE